MSSDVIRRFFTLWIVLQSAARTGRVFSFVRNVTGSIKSAQHYLSLTLCLSRKRFRHAWSICSPERLQHSAFNSWSQPQTSKKKLFVRTQTGSQCCFREMNVVCDWFLLPQTSPLRSRCLICDVLKKTLRFHTSSVEKQSYLLSALVCSEVSTVLPDIPYRHVSLCEKKPPVNRSIFSNVQTCLPLEHCLCIW